MGKRAWPRILSGRRLDLPYPSPLGIETTDMARGPARVAALLQPDKRRACLFHDAAFITGLAPVGRMQSTCALHSPPGLVKLRQRIKQADRAATFYEAARPAGFPGDEAMRCFVRPNGAVHRGLILPWTDAA